MAPNAINNAQLSRAHRVRNTNRLTLAHPKRSARGFQFNITARWRGMCQITVEIKVLECARVIVGASLGLAALRVAARRKKVEHARASASELGAFADESYYTLPTY